MADLFSRSFHCLWVPCRNLPPNPSERLRVSSPFPFPKRWVGFTHHTHILTHSTSPSSSSVPEDDVHIISSTQCSDGSFVFRFGSASEIREKIGDLEQEKPVHEGVEEGGARALLSVEKLSNEVGHNLVEETESSSSIVVVGVADQNPQLLVNEKESFVLDDDPETPVINDSQKFDRHLRLDSVEDGDGHHGITSEDVAAESNVVPGVSEEDSQVDSHKAVVVSTVSLEKDMFSYPSSGASGEGEEKEEADKDHGVDRATNSLTGGVGADVSELLPVSTSLEPEQVVNGATHNLAGGVDANSSESVPVSTSLESEQVLDGTTDNLTGGVDADSSELVPVSTSIESEQVLDSETDNLTGGVDADSSESVPTSTSLESEQVLDSATDNLTGGVDADTSEPVPVSSSLESGQVLDSATDNMTGGVDADSSELVPVSTSLGSEQVLDSAKDNLTGGVDADSSESVPTSTSLESEQVLDSATDNLTGGVDSDLSESVPTSTSLESEVHANYEETTCHIVDDSVDASKIGKSESLHDLVPSSDLENKIDVGNTDRSDYGNISRITVPEMHSVEMASHGEKTSRTELFLVSGVAYLPHPSKALTGREDAYFISRQNWLAVADGVGQWSLEGGNTGLYIRELMEKCENIVSNYENISIKPAEVLTRSAAETQTPGSSSLLVAYFDGQALHAANVGNTGFIIIRDSSIFKKSTVRFHEFSFPLQIVKGDDPSVIIEEYEIDLNDGDVIVFATNGLFDNLYEQEIASIISKSLQASLGPQEIAELLAMRAQEVGRSTSTRSPFGDAAQAVGYVGYAGGKLDDVTVIVSLLQTK